jgi:4-hydroxybenzoate polyprenyltransferase
MLNINKKKIIAFIHLGRFHKPIGFYLLLWPMLTALLFAANGKPEIKNLIIFCLGLVCVRSAGCAINDIADRNFDAHVARTQYRPLATGAISVKAAAIFTVVMFLLAFALVLNLNTTTIWLSVFACITTCIYPLFKRFFVAPQFMLSIPFSWSIPMAYAAENSTIDLSCWLLLAANMLWVIAYDTQYAMADREDDLKIGLKSSAIWFGNKDNLIIAILQITVILLLAVVGYLNNLKLPFFIGLDLASVGFIYQYSLTKNRDRDLCLKAFLNNNKVGLVIFLGTLLSYY